jgi:hypothetical protein
MQMASIIFSIIAIISYYLIGKKNIKGFYGWFISNTGMLLLAILNKDFGQMILWVVYNILNIKAIIEWRKNDEKSNNN